MNRKLSDTERVVWLAERANSLNSAAVARIGASLDEHPLRVALNWLQKRHSMLRTRVDIAGGRAPLTPDAEAIPSISLRVEPRVSNDHWQSEARRELDQTMPWTRGPLISVVLLKSEDASEIIVALHQVMKDNASVLYLMRDLLGLLAQVIKGGRTPSLQVYPERRALDDLPLGASKLMDSMMKTTALMAAQVTHVLLHRDQKLPKNSDTRRALPKPNAPRTGDALHQTGCARMLHYVLSSEETKILLDKCKEENTTLHGAITAAVLQAAGRHICASATNASAAVPISCLSSPRMSRVMPDRGRAGKLGLEIGLFVPVVTAAHYIGKRAMFWDIARHTERTVQDAVKEDEPLAAVPLPADFAQRLSQASSGAILVTNVGRLGVPNPYGAIVPHETRATAAATTMADCFGVVVNRLPGRLMLSFFYPEAALSEDRVSLLGAMVVKQLRASIITD